MKNNILKITAVVLIAGAALTSCNSSTDKVENAQQAVEEADQELREANEAYLRDIEQYRKETAERIEAHNQSIADFTSRIENEKAEAKADYENQIAELEQKNSDLEMRMKNYKADGKEEWEEFKTEFNHDMDELGKAFSDLTVNNTSQ